MRADELTLVEVGRIAGAILEERPHWSVGGLASRLADERRCRNYSRGCRNHSCYETDK